MVAVTRQTDDNGNRTNAGYQTGPGNFASVADNRSGKPINDGPRMARTTLVAIMGRMAAYTGQEISWQQAMDSQDKLAPDKIDWTTPLPLRPTAIPGVTKVT